MLKRIRAGLFSFGGAGILVGAAGAISAVAGLFLNLDQTLTMRWFLALIWIGVTLVVVLLKIIHDLSVKPPVDMAQEAVVDYDASTQVLLIRRNPNFSNTVLVSGYHVRGDLEELIFLGAVYHVQLSMVQLRITDQLAPFDVASRHKEIVVRPTIPAGLFANTSGRRP